MRGSDFPDRLPQTQLLSFAPGLATSTAVSPPIAESSKPMNSATANGVLSPLAIAPTTSARAMPIDTAVTATAVDNASAAVVINSTNATGRCLEAEARRPSHSIPEFDSVNIFHLRESVFEFGTQIAADAGAGSAGLGQSL
jgi:hypothetical protein